MEATITEYTIDRFRNLLESADPRVPRIVQLCLQGKDWAEIAADLGTTERTVWALRQRYKVEDYVRYVNANAISAAQTAYVTSGKKTFQRLVQLLDSDNRDDQKFAIREVLTFMAKRGDGPNKSDDVGDTIRSLRSLSDGELDAVIEGSIDVGPSSDGEPEPEP